MPTVTVPVNSASNDGCGERAGASWPPTGGWTDTSNQGSNLIDVYKDADPAILNGLAYLRFDTSVIPAGAEITAATLKLVVSWANDTDEAFSLVGDYYDFGGEPTVIGDYVETCSPSIFNAVSIGLLVVDSVNDFSLTDLTGINVSGYTGIRLSLSSGTPVSANQVGFASYEHPTLQEPRLEVSYLGGAVQSFYKAGRSKSRGVSW